MYHSRTEEEVKRFEISSEINFRHSFDCVRQVEMKILQVHLLTSFSVLVQTLMSVLPVRTIVTATQSVQTQSDHFDVLVTQDILGMAQTVKVSLLRSLILRLGNLLNLLGSKFCIVLKGSVERSLLPWAIFLTFTQNRPWKSEDHLCMLFFIEMSKERLEKSERTPPVSWRPWALAYSRDRPYNFSCLSALSKNGRFRSFFSDLGCHLASKSLSWPAMPVSNKKQEFEQWKRIKLFTDFWVRAYRFDFAPGRRPRARSM